MEEFVETLGNGISLVCSKTHGFGTDAILLANFAAPKVTDKCCDLGTGCGIIPFIWLRDGVKDIVGMDIQELAIEQFGKSLDLNGNPAGISAVLGDLREIDKYFKGSLGTFDVVSMNPPYKIAGSGILSQATPDQIARHEITCNVDDACKAAGRLLNFGGRFLMCHRPERLADVITAMRAYDIEPKKLRFVQKRPDTAPWLFLIEGKRGAKPFLEVLPPLYIENENGENSEELDRILGEYKKGSG